MSEQQSTSLYCACSDTHSWIEETASFPFSLVVLSFCIYCECMPLYISWQTYLKLFPFNLWWLLLLLFELSASSDGNGLLTKSGKNVDKSPWCKPRVHSTWHNQALSMKWAPTHFHLHVPALCFVSRPWQGYGFIFFLALKLRDAKIYNIFLPNQSCLVIRHGQNLTPKKRIFKFDAISTFSCFHK